MTYKDYFGKSIENLADKKLFLFDMDGTIYMENSVFEGVNELLSRIERNGGKYVFITNNSSKSVNAYIEKLRKMNIVCDENNFFTSTQASAMLLNEKFPNQKIYVQGTKSMVSELIKYGVDITEDFSDNVGAILVGFDTELTTAKMRTTSEMLTKVKVPYFATNPDWVCPVEFGYVPDCGSMCFGYEKATGRKPVFIGKPDPTMVNLAMKKFGIEKADTLVLGDRIYTDIASGYNAGVDTIMVLTGEATLEDYKASDIKPTFVLNHVKELLSVIK